jgi:hypothetical protein
LYAIEINTSPLKGGKIVIQIRVEIKKDIHTQVNELYDAVREETRVWSMGDLRRTKNLKLVHQVRNIKGTVRRVNTKNKEALDFECKAKDDVSEAITTGRFVHLVLRYLGSAKKITISRQ